MVAMEWLDIEPVIGCKISDFIIQHKKVEDPLEAEIYTGKHGYSHWTTKYILLHISLTFTSYRCTASNADLLLRT